MKNVVYLFIFSIVMMLLLSNCGGKRKAIGNEDEIIVVADSSEFYDLEGTLIEVFEKKIITPQEESLFLISQADMKDLSKVQRRKNVVFISTLDSESGVGNYMRGILDSSVFSMVEKDSEFVFIKKDLWAKDQLVMFLVSPTTSLLEKNMLTKKENLIHYFQQISNKRLFKSLYNEKYERKDLEAQLLRDYGWIIYIQADFQIAKNIAEDNFVWLRRAINTDMERWIFVHWIENATPEWLNNDSITVIRDRLTKKHYINSDNTTRVIVQYEEDYNPVFREVNFNNKYAILTQGFWRFDDKSGGGPFLSYTFFDEKTKRIYMLDGSIYAPKYYKKKLIQQVDVTLQSFLVEHELSQDKKENLLEELE